MSSGLVVSRMCFSPARSVADHFSFFNLASFPASHHRFCRACTRPSYLQKLQLHTVPQSPLSFIQLMLPQTSNTSLRAENTPHANFRPQIFPNKATHTATSKFVFCDRTIYKALNPSVHRRTIYARQYQGWEYRERPSKLALLFRPVLFAGIFLVGSVSIAVIAKEERLKRTKWTLFPKSYHDFWGWHLSTGQVVAGAIIAVNGFIFSCWRWSLHGTEALEQAAPWLRRHFLHYAFSGRAFPLLGSVFSHATFLHLLFNMMALW